MNDEKSFKDSIIELLNLYDKPTLMNMIMDFYYDEKPDIMIRMTFENREE